MSIKILLQKNFFSSSMERKKAGNCNSPSDFPRGVTTLNALDDCWLFWDRNMLVLLFISLLIFIFIIVTLKSSGSCVRVSDDVSMVKIVITIISASFFHNLFLLNFFCHLLATFFHFYHFMLFFSTKSLPAFYTIIS